MTKKLRGLFLNTEKAICSIYESGKMCYDCLVESENYLLDYLELSVNKREISLNYDFYIFNYHFVQMRWLDTRLIRNLPGFKATIVLEVSQNSPFDCVSKDDFDAYLVLDPTCKHFLNNVYSFPRPLEVYSHPINSHMESKIPIIGTFGLSFHEKGFEEVICAVNEEFDEAIIKINVPDSGNISKYSAADFKASLADFNLKDEIKVELSNYYFTKEDLVKWCAKNTLNVFLYNRRIGNGMSTTTDQAIASGRPLAISTNPTFRHIHAYIKPYPYLSLRESIELTTPLVKQIQNDWNPHKFLLRFEEVLNDNNIVSISKLNSQKYKLPIRVSVKNHIKKLFTKEGLTSFIPPIIHKLITIINKNNSVQQDVPLLQPFVHQVLLSNSQFQEDLLIDLLMNRKKFGVYVDIGVSDPFFNNNTQRFYLRGWRGINIDSNLSNFKKIVENREFDINLNLAISEELDNLTLIKSTADIMPLSKILNTHLDKRHIDFLSVNVGGQELTVLNSNKWDLYRPTLVLVGSKIRSREIILFMDKNKYLYLFSNHINAIFVDKLTTDQNILDLISWNNQSLK